MFSENCMVEKLLPNNPENEFTKMKIALTAAVCFTVHQPKRIKIGLKIIPPPMPNKPEIKPMPKPKMISIGRFCLTENCVFGKIPKNLAIGINNISPRITL